MALVVDLSPDPRQDRCFYHVLRELADMMETSSLNSSQTNGHPFFKTEDNKTYQNLLEKKEKNRAKLGAMKIETPSNFDFLILLALKSKVYYKQFIDTTTDTENINKKECFKHKGISSASKLTYETFLKILTENYQTTVKEKQFKIEKFQIFASEIEKKCSNNLDNKRYFFNSYFSLPYGHSDIEKYESK